MKWISLSLLFLMISCGQPIQESLSKDSVAYKNRHRNLKLIGDFYHKDGTCKNYIGHRMGGDFKGIPDNTIHGALEVKAYESHPCFKRWEFDVNSAKNCILVRHDYFYFNSKGDKGLVRRNKCNRFKNIELNEFVDRMIIELDPTARVSIDLKEVSEKHWLDVIVQAEKLQEAGIKVNFQGNNSRKKKYAKLEQMINDAGFKVSWNY